METSLCKIKIDESMIGKAAFIAAQPEVYDVCEWGQFTAVKIMPGAVERSIIQNNTYWACVEIFREHKCDNPEFSTKEKCHAQIRWAIKYINKESAVHFVDKNGNSRLYFELDSISFSTPQKKVNLFYTDAFQYIADELGCTVDELVAEAQARMKSRRVCRMCGSTQKIQTHHLFSNTKQNRELYGRLLDDPRNLMDLCADCHLNKSIPKMTEAEFCKTVGIEMESKSGKGVA